MGTGAANTRAIPVSWQQILEIADGSFHVRKPPQIRGSGYVVRSLKAALWAFHDAADFRQACFAP